MLTRTGRKILDHNLTSLIRMDPDTPRVLDELVLDIHEHPQLVCHQIVTHRYFEEVVYGILRIMDIHTAQSPRISGNAAYLLGSLLESETGREKVIEILKNPERIEETQHCLPNLASLIETYDLEPQTNASGTTALIFEIEGSRNWAFEQASSDWLIFILARCLHETDMWVAANCALTLARICMHEEGRKKILEHKENEFILSQMILAVGVDNEGRGMNSAFAIAYLCDTEEGTKKIAYMKECLDLILGLIKMLRSVDDGCRKNAVFSLKTLSQWEDGQDRINDDPDIELLLKLLCNLLTCGDEDLSKLSSVTLKNLSIKREGYLLQRDLAPTKTTLEHVLKQMNISENYRKDAFEALKALMLPKPERPQLNVLDAYSVTASWEEIKSKSGADVFYELYCDDNIAYTGNQLSFTCRNLNERTEYEFRVRAFTDEDEESFISEGSVIQTFRAISSPPRNLRQVGVTSTQIKIVWERPVKVCGNLKGYYLQEQGSSIHYEPTSLYHIASNLEPDKEYTFEVCAVTQRGRGEMASLTVRTLRNDYYKPSKPKLLTIGSHEMAVSWKPPLAPPGRINGYEVLCDGKAIYYGMNRRCIASMLKPDKKYRFSVVAWTSSGRIESDYAEKKMQASYKHKPRKQPWKNKEELMRWLHAKEENDEEDEFYSDDDATTARSDSVSDSVSKPEGKEKKDGDNEEEDDGVDNVEKEEGNEPADEEIEKEEEEEDTEDKKETKETTEEDADEIEEDLPQDENVEQEQEQEEEEDDEEEVVLDEVPPKQPTPAPKEIKPTAPKSDKKKARRAERVNAAPKR